MEDQFVPYNLALKLKELGFDEICFAGYTKGGNQIRMSQQVPYIGADYGWKKYNHQNKHIIKAPLWQQAFEWFREKHNLISGMAVYKEEFVKTGLARAFEPHILNLTTNQSVWLDEFDNYEEARQACLEKLIEICQEQKEELEQKV